MGLACSAAASSFSPWCLDSSDGVCLTRKDLECIQARIAVSKLMMRQCRLLASAPILVCGVLKVGLAVLAGTRPRYRMRGTQHFVKHLYFLASHSALLEYPLTQVPRRGLLAAYHMSSLLLTILVVASTVWECKVIIARHICAGTAHPRLLV